MKHKIMSLYVHNLEGGCEDAGRVDLEGYVLISNERLYDLETAEKDAIEQARLNGIGGERELALMAQVERLERALIRISNWNEHSMEVAIEHGSNGVRDHYRQIAWKALEKTQ